MRYSRFEDLPVWNSAIDLAAHIYDFTEKPEFRRRHSLRDQIERAAVSVSNNIAEGFERGTNNELLSFLYISRGSAGEVRSMLCLLDRIPTFQPAVERNNASQKESRKLLATIESLGTLTPEFRIQGRASRQFKDEARRASGERARRVPDRAR